MVFFFPCEKLAAGLHGKYRKGPCVLIKVGTRSLLAAHGSSVRLAGINTGYTGRAVTLRGRDTFQPVPRYDHAKRSVKEVAVLQEVADLRDHIVSVEHLARSAMS